MKLVVGLGNPGRRYEGTRHNVGFMVASELARRHATGRPRTAFHGETLDAEIDGARTLLLCPHTLMNRSGLAVGDAVDFYKLDHQDVLVICDDFNLPLGKLRLRGQGSAGGQKGLADIIRRFGGDDCPRLRVGIGSPPGGWNNADYVLSKFAKDELPEIELATARAADAVRTWVTEGLGPAMNRYNADG